MQFEFEVRISRETARARAMQSVPRSRPAVDSRTVRPARTVVTCETSAKNEDHRQLPKMAILTGVQMSLGNGALPTDFHLRTV